MSDSHDQPMHGIYRHYKGDLYAVLGVVRDATDGPTDGRVLVLYYSLSRQKLWAREYGQFHGQVTMPDGTQKPRFELVTG